MNTTAIFAAGLALAAAATSASALAADRLSDQQFIKASRCAAIAGSPAMGPQDTTAINAALKSESRGRESVILTMAKQEAATAARQAKSQDRKASLEAELNGACVAYLRPSEASGQP